MKPSVKARCVRCYTVRSNNKSDIVSFESVFHDVEGTRFHFSSYRSIAKELEKKIFEGECYTITGFAVVQNSVHYKLTDHKFKGTLFQYSELRHEPSVEFPRLVYSFVAFTEILAIEDVKDTLPLDVIGRLRCIPAPSKYTRTDGVEADLLNFDLEDDEGTILKCTLWDEFIGSFMHDYEANKDNQTIVIVQFGKLNKYKGETKIQSRNLLTKILINEDIPDVIRFRERLDISISNGKCVADPLTAVDGRIDDVPVTTIENLNTCKQGGTFWVTGKVVHIEDESGWYYIACKKCTRKLQEDDNRYLCPKCDSYSDDMEVKYKVVFHVADDTTLALFMVWDRDCKKFIGKTAGELRSLHSEGAILPCEFGEVFLGKTFFFKITVPVVVPQRYNRSFNVSVMATDVAGRSVHSDCTSEKIDSMTNSGCQGSQSVGVCYPMHTPSASQSVVGDSTEFSSGESLKRNLADEFSSTKELKRVKEMIKEEKS